MTKGLITQNPTLSSPTHTAASKSPPSSAVNIIAVASFPSSASFSFQSSFSTIFPRYREKYLQDAWPKVKSALKEYGISAELNLAIKILNDEMQCNIIKIGSLVRNKALEILTGKHYHCITAMGSFEGLKQVRRIVEDCIENKMHPVYNIKILMMKKELEKDPALKSENWDRFLPKFKKKNVQTKKVKSKEKKPYTPFPPSQQPCKIDQELESGEYFLSEKKKLAKWQEKQAQKTAENKRKREESFVLPKVRTYEPRFLQVRERQGRFVALAMSLKMIDDQQLGFLANFLGIFIFALVIAYHYVMADPKYEGS
ncbi:hypothetical protein DITRI_Ditri09bG0127900 [Diplodiscus trichospermus]